MSDITMTNTPGTAVSASVPARSISEPARSKDETIRNTMSFANLLTTPPAAAPDVSSGLSGVAAPPSTPVKDRTPIKEEVATTPGDSINTPVLVASLSTPVKGLASPEKVATTPDDSINTPVVVAPPSTPAKGLTSLKDEVTGTPDTVMSDESASEAVDESTEGGAADNNVEREFNCYNDGSLKCNTGQVTMDLSRKVISDHFGRNKACTRYITDWPLFCRKHYQRSTYDRVAWQKRKVHLINRQFEIIEKQFPGTTYDVHFKKSEEVRLNQYSRQVASGMSREASAASVAPKAGKHFEASINVLRELDTYLGDNKSINEAKHIMGVIAQMLEKKDTDQVPAIEFLPNIPGKDATPKKTPAKLRASKSPKTPQTPSRISAKGAIKKTPQKA